MTNKDTFQNKVKKIAKTLNLQCNIMKFCDDKTKQQLTSSNGISIQTGN